MSAIVNKQCQTCPTTASGRQDALSEKERTPNSASLATLASADIKLSGGTDARVTTLATQLTLAGWATEFEYLHIREPVYAGSSYTTGATTLTPDSDTSRRPPMRKTTGPGADRTAGPAEAAELRRAVVVTLGELGRLSAELDLADRAACTPASGWCQTEPPSVSGVELFAAPHRFRTALSVATVRSVGAGGRA